MSDHGRKNNAYLNNQIEIYNLLKSIQKSRQLIALSINSDYQQCLTSLLEVDLNKNLLIFDEPNPELNPKQIKFTQRCQFSLNLEKLPVKFNTTISLKDAEDNNELLAPFPDEIYYPQQRQYYRYRTEFIENIDTTIFLSAEVKLHCKLINISLSGLKLQLAYANAKSVQPNQVLNDIYVQLPEQKGFSVSARVKNTQVVNNYNNVEIGLEVLEQKANIEKLIQQFIYRSDNI